MNQLVNRARTIISADKFRFTKDGFNLDLVYVTPRIIGIHFPNKKFYSKRIIKFKFQKTDRLHFLKQWDFLLKGQSQPG
jgi:hypothetical protein